VFIIRKARQMARKAALILAISIISFFIASCGNKENFENSSAYDVFMKAKEYFDDEDYLQAQKLFDMIKLQYPASQFADDAQFYLAKSSYERGEFIVAAYHFGTVRRVYPNSEYAKDALYQKAMCFYELSPTYDRDQEYTIQAINALTEFQVIYGTDSLAIICDGYIDELREKLGRRDYSIAFLYQKVYYYQSALIYYDSVIENFADTKYYEPAFFGKIEVLFLMKQNEECLSVIDAYQKNFPNGEFIDQVNDYEKQIKEFKSTE
jgi:outer membrane protein assembly factor BamD